MKEQSFSLKEIILEINEIKVMEFSLLNLFVNFDKMCRFEVIDKMLDFLLLFIDKNNLYNSFDLIGVSSWWSIYDIYLKIGFDIIASLKQNFYFKYID